MRLIISVSEDSQVLFSSSEVLRPSLENYQLASPVLRRHKLNHGRCACLSHPISCVKKYPQDWHLSSIFMHFFLIFAIFSDELQKWEL